MLNYLWGGMLSASILYAFANGSWRGLWETMLGGAGRAIAFTIQLAAGYAFFCGFLRIARDAGVQRAFTRLLQPGLRRLFPSLRGQASVEAIAMNFSANMLGLGNAATPMGIEAMRAMQAESLADARVQEDMRLFLVINATSLQLLPTTVLTLRATAGSAAPAAVIGPTLLCSLVSTVVGVLLCRLCAKAARNARA